MSEPRDTTPRDGRLRRARYRQAPGEATGLHAGWTTAADAPAPAGVDGGFVRLGGEEHYCIRGFDRMPPFLVNLPTDTDLWMFVSSAGGLTAGRRDPDGAIFPYETVDRLHDAHHHTGPVTLVRIEREGRASRLWEPFAPVPGPAPGGERRLYKNTTGNRIVFEEADGASPLVFRYRWAGSDATGWVRTATLENRGREPVALALLDGVRNLLPFGAPLSLYQHSSCLVDAYKRVDLDEPTGLAIVSLTARVSDRPEPADELRATVAWRHGLPGARVALDAGAIAAFRRGEAVGGGRVLTGRRGSYLVATELVLPPGGRAEWHLALDTGLSHVQVAALRARLERGPDVGGWIAASLDRADENLRRIVAASDGLQLTRRPEVSAHHFANVLFNDLRGGVFARHHAVPGADFAAFVRARDRALAGRHADFLAGLPAELDVRELHAATAASGDPDLRRLGLEYLPLYFGRRHGDPSRPWNRFSIVVREPSGERALRFEGNWRDVFQNWEALTRSFPGFLPGVIARFVDASTVDGFNPYRVTRDGFDWEVLEPDAPWSGIGYWGDHQVVYLLRLLESMRRHEPGALEALLAEEVFSWADVPYRIAPYPEILAHPRSTIRYDAKRAAEIAAREAATGHDAKLLRARDGGVQRASLLEKLVVPALAKLSNLVADGGIWMNTERPEWNDANNALVGNGLSVVTVCHLRGYLRFLDGVLEHAGTPSYTLGTEVADWQREVAAVLERYRGALARERVDERTRKQLLDALGGAFTTYRERVYAAGFSGRTSVPTAELRAWLRVAGEHVDHAIRANRRPDGLYHAYNLMSVSPDGARIAVQPLGLMLEGQVAALGSGLVDGPEAAALLEALFESPLHRADQDSFMLYPDHELPPFLERNRVPDERADAVPLLGALLAAGDVSLVERDADGVLRFAGGLGTTRELAAALDRLAADPAWAAVVARDRRAVTDLHEDVLEHRTFTGRSCRMYAYEGLGCIYWHMVSKLLLAAQEAALRAREEGEGEAFESLARACRRLRDGLGAARTAAGYGAFPTDPYSHTPAGRGAQQPGMTGQVKEEILARFDELGVRVRDGIVEFDPALLRRDEFLAAPGRLETFDAAGAPCTIDVPAGAMAFTLCQVPVVVHAVRGAAWIRVTGADGRESERSGGTLDDAASRDLLARRGAIARIDVGVPERALRDD